MIRNCSTIRDRENQVEKVAKKRLNEIILLNSEGVKHKQNKFVRVEQKYVKERMSDELVMDDHSPRLDL